MDLSNNSQHEPVCRTSVWQPDPRHTAAKRRQRRAESNREVTGTYADSALGKRASKSRTVTQYGLTKSLAIGCPRGRLDRPEYVACQGK